MVRQAVRDILVFAFLAGLALGYSSDANAELGDRVPLGNNESGHLILGTSKPYDRGGIEILRDAKIGNLRIRHVRAVNITCTSGVDEWLEIDGEIGPDSTAVVERLLPQLPTCISANGVRRANPIYLSSNGGLQSHGFRLGQLFRKHRVTTVVGVGAVCASACAVAYLGGVRRHMAEEAKLLFHAPYNTGLFGDQMNCRNQGQVGALKNYFVSMLGEKNGNYLLERTMSYCSSSTGWTLNGDAAGIFNITTAVSWRYFFSD